METEVIKTAHENGHFGIQKVEKSICQHFFITKLKKKIQKSIIVFSVFWLNKKKKKKEI